VSLAVPLRVLSRDGAVRAEAIIDAADWPEFGRRRYHLANGYVRRGAGASGKVFSLHREILGLKPGDRRKADHVNGNPLDCRRANLRITDDSGNVQNQHRLRSDNASGYRGVSFQEKTGKWVAQACLLGRRIHLGYYDDAREAATVAARFRARHMPLSRDARTR
jgi:hypothetical protein